MWIKLSNLIFVLLVSGFSYSQTIIIEDFESYDSGSQIAIEAGNPWTTWNNLPGGIEDPVISVDTAFSDSNAVFITDSNDLVLLLGDRESGKYRLDFRFFVHSDRAGYFSILQNFDGNHSITGLQVFLNNNDSATVDAGGTNVKSFSFTMHKWHHVRLFIDLDIDFASFIFNGSEQITWQWSKGAFNNSNLLKLDAVNFYGWNQQDTAGFYIDDVKFTQLDTMNAPFNLISSSSNDTIVLNWERAEGDSLTHYRIIRNGELLSVEVSDTFYINKNLYPKIYNYRVLAFYKDYGYSPVSNLVTDTVLGGIERNFVLYEIGTGTWNQYCTGVEKASNELINNGLSAAIINYHYIDDYHTSFGFNRLNYYGVNGIPTTIINGTDYIFGGDANESMYDSFLEHYEYQMDIPSLYKIDLNDSLSGDTLYSLTIRLEEMESWFTEDFVLHAMLTDTTINDLWFGLDEVNNIYLSSISPDGGEDVSFADDSVLTLNYTKEIDSTYIGDFLNNTLIVFLQYKTTKEVVQVQKKQLTELKTVLGTKIKNQKIFTIYPNPAKEYIKIKEIENSTINIYNITGQLLISKEIMNADENINVSFLPAGIYYINIIQDNNKYISKLVISKNQ